MTSQEFWEKAQGKLDSRIPKWRELIEHYQQVSAIEARARGKRLSDDEIFAALVRSVLSNSTDWSKVERVLPELSSCFGGFDPHSYAARLPASVDEVLLPWFKQRHAGSMTLRSSLLKLIAAAERLCSASKAAGSLENYFHSIFVGSGKDPKQMAVALGGMSSPHKLPTLGIPLAAEFLKNIGYDVAKPDRHVNRAVGSFGWVTFAKWKSRAGTTPPTASEAELLKVMQAMESIGIQLATPVAYLDNAIWLLCAKSGLHMTNDELARLSGNSGDR